MTKSSKQLTGDIELRGLKFKNVLPDRWECGKYSISIYAVDERKTQWWATLWINSSLNIGTASHKSSAADALHELELEFERQTLGAYRMKELSAALLKLNGKLPESHRLPVEKFNTKSSG